MAIGLQNYPNITAPDSDYPNGKIKDDTGSDDGTPIDLLTNGDIQETFAKILRLASISPSGIPDNEYSGHQYINALQYLINTTETKWIPLVLINGWQDASGGRYVPSYTIRNGRMYFKGAILSPSSSASNIFCVLPSRDVMPLINLIFICGSTASESPLSNPIGIYAPGLTPAGGTCCVIPYSGSTGGSTMIVLLESISYSLY